MGNFTFQDLKNIKRTELGNMVPLELFRAIRLIGMNEGLPLGGKNTTAAIGRKIGESLPAQTVEELFELFIQLKIGIPVIVQQDDHTMRIAVEDCFCEGLPVQEGKFVCDMEGAIMEGALKRIMNRNVFIKEVKCNVNGDEHCEYELRLFH
ncbi:V4R domain-containing protein [Paenibacillus sp.]|jgi:predicted hydrocarbon binding protein|uniref:V4R domain-containing protein n=1 Tax=Paenibacillus sp. TaxID=58172 RepID=UPI00282F910B|nr:V4R domain-containing protein [Paenibacillus sp.]MDR0270753.1 4-vinyl reductase [Paenibacillus sp.]